MKVSEMFQKRFMKADDIVRDTTLTMDDVTEETVAGDDGNEESCFILWFTEIDKGLRLNVTNAVKIQSLLDDEDTANWKGHRITLYKSSTPFKGNPNYPCVRVRDQLPKAKAARRA